MCDSFFRDRQPDAISFVKLAARTNHLADTSRKVAEHCRQDLAREANFFDLETLLRVLAAKLAAVCDGDSIAEDVDQWLESQEHLLKRFEALLSELRSGISDLSMLTVGLSDLKDLVDSASRGQRLNAPSE